MPLSLGHKLGPYEILAPLGAGGMGKRAFEGYSPASVIAAIMERAAPSIATIALPALDRFAATLPCERSYYNDRCHGT